MIHVLITVVRFTLKYFNQLLLTKAKYFRKRCVI